LSVSQEKRGERIEKKGKYPTLQKGKVLHQEIAGLSGGREGNWSSKNASDRRKRENSAGVGKSPSEKRQLADTYENNMNCAKIKIEEQEEKKRSCIGGGRKEGLATTWRGTGIQGRANCYSTKLLNYDLVGGG